MEEINQSIYAIEKQKQRNGQQWLIWALQINLVNRKEKDCWYCITVGVYFC